MVSPLVMPGIQTCLPRYSQIACKNFWDILILLSKQTSHAFSQDHGNHFGIYTGIRILICCMQQPFLRS